MSARVEGMELYGLLRNLTSPIVAITTAADGRRNGLIANSAQRASLVLSLPRVSLYVSKTNFSHDLIYRSGVFGMHLLHTEQWEVVRVLGLQSGRELEDKLAGLHTTTGETGCPLLADAFLALECRVANAMDAGAATFFLGDVVMAQRGDGEVMTSDFFRANLPPDMRRAYEARLEVAQRELQALAGQVDRTKLWPGPVTVP